MGVGDEAGGGGERYSIFSGRWENHIGWTWHFIGGLENPLEIMLHYLTLIS